VADVSESTVARAETGGAISPAMLVKISAALRELELHRPVGLEEELASMTALAQLVALPRTAT
jgi:hypothetical protein